MNKNLELTVKEYLKNKKFTIKPISDAKSDNHGAFLIKSENIKFKANLFEDQEELNNFIKFAPLIKKSSKILAHKENIVLTEWIEGKTIHSKKLTAIDIKDIAKLQAEIHNLKVKYNKKEIIKNFKKRLNRYIEKLEKISALSSEEIIQIKNKIEKEFPKNPKISLIHNDWIAVNLLKTKKGWYSIDNELLSIGLTGFDLGKPINNMCKDENQSKIYLKSYSTVSSIDFYTKNKEFYQLAYLVKALYSRLTNPRLKTDKVYKKMRELIN